MKKLFMFLVVVGLGVGVFFAVQISGAQQLNGYVDALAKFPVPADPYNDPITEKLVTNSGKKITRTRSERWNKNHGDDQVVKHCWARRKEGTIPLCVELIKDTTKPANQRIAAMLVIGFATDALTADRVTIVPALAEQLSNTGERIAEFAAFALGEFAKEEVDDAAAEVYSKATSNDVKYYALVALRDARVIRDTNARFSKVAEAPMIDAFKTGDKPLKLLVATEARHLHGLDFGGFNLIDGLMAMVGDADIESAKAGVYSLRYKVSELDQTDADLKGRADEVVVKAKELYRAGGPDHARANAISAVTFVNDERANVTMGMEIPVDTELYAEAREKDSSNPVVMGAVAEGLGKHGTLEERIQMVNLLLEADCAPALAAGIGVGLSKCKDKYKNDIVNTKALEALKSTVPHVVQAAAAIVGKHGAQKNLIELAEAFDAATDDDTKEAIKAAAKLKAGKPVNTSKEMVKYAKP